MSILPPANPGTAAFAGGYSVGKVPGLPTSPDEAFAPGRIDSRARNAVLLGILAIPLSVVAGIRAIVVGRHALRRIDASDGTLPGRTAAWIGIVLGWLSIAVFAVPST